MEITWDRRTRVWGSSRTQRDAYYCWLSEKADEWRGPVGVIVWMGEEKEPTDITFCRADTVFYTVCNTH